jgi:EpsI family protein
MISVAYSGSTQTKHLRAHRQEVCYTAQGFKIEKLKRENITISGFEVPATQVLAVQGLRSEPFAYSFTMGDQVVRSFMDRELAQLKYAVSGYLPNGYLLSMSSLSKDADKAFAEQQAFAEALFAGLDEKLVGKLLGEKS